MKIILTEKQIQYLKSNLILEDEDVMKAIKDMGHDSFYVSEGDDKNIAVFHPHQIKSAVGNRGTFDPTKKDINRATGGHVPSLDTMRLATGGQVQGNTMPTLAQMKFALSNPANQSIGTDEAPDMSPKVYFPPVRSTSSRPHARSWHHAKRRCIP